MTQANWFFIHEWMCTTVIASIKSIYSNRDCVFVSLSFLSLFTSTVQHQRLKSYLDRHNDIHIQQINIPKWFQKKKNNYYNPLFSLMLPEHNSPYVFEWSLINQKNIVRNHFWSLIKSYKSNGGATKIIINKLIALILKKE